ncbi:methyl-accepting chemotaxis protein [Marinomonas pollencensis]|uniref:Methyl-accepting chemotaxis protein n=1 Tax=Marinomonas pollencensis TaxID=491954 RepID=A0A3E0DQ52_9GAMM|nr:methyl-accepting chemotaxis protein [Marinomonas pollencensis]REG85086.1 methyl-accepting chemotaxis protein [Marinomonas pollencensis]
MSLSVIQRILLGFGVLLLLLLVIAGSGFTGIKKIEGSLNDITGNVAQISAQSNELSHDLSLANAAVLQYLLSKSPDSLAGLKKSFEGYKADTDSLSAELQQSVSKHPVMEDLLNEMNLQLQTFYKTTQVAFTNHERKLNLQAKIPDKKFDLKDDLAYTIDDLTSISDDSGTQAAKFAASYVRIRLESLQVSIGDYFDTTDLTDMQSMKETMAKTFVGLEDKLNYLNNVDIKDSIDLLAEEIQKQDSVINDFYEYTRLNQEAEVIAKQLSSSMSKVDELTKALLNSTVSMRDQAKVAANDSAAFSTLMMGVVLLVSVLIAIAITLWVSRSIRRPLNEVMVVLGKISEGDFTQRSQVKTNDEFGDLSRWVNDLVVKLQQVMKDIDKASNDVSESAQNNVRLAGDTKVLMRSQNEQTSSVATAMTEMAATVQEVAKNSEITLSQIQHVDLRANESREQMERNITDVEHLVTQLEQSTAVVNQLDEYSQNIGRILEVIQEIAEQTNLLALNAAIEAARAGEHGRGFAVVADEVRTLATRTHSSTEEIQHVINQLQQSVKQTVASMEESRNGAYSSVENTRLVGTSINELQASMAEIRDLSTQIATAAEQQSLVAQDITKSVHEISDMSDQAAHGADQSEQDSSRLSSLATHQRALLTQFKTV